MDKEEAKNKNGKWQDFVDHCFAYYEECEKSEYRKRKIKTIEKAYQVYEQQEEEDTIYFDNESKVVLPMTTITIDNLEPRLHAGLIGKKPVVQMEIEGMSEQPEETKIIEGWFNKELEQVVKLETLTGDIVHKILLEGTIFPITTYDEDEVTRRDFVYDENRTIQSPYGMITNPDYGKMIFDETSQEFMTEDITDSIFQGGKVEFAEFSDVYVADDGDNWEDTDVIRIVRPTYAELQQKKNQPGYMNIGKWLLSEEKQDKLDEDSQSPAQRTVDIEKTGKETIECLECSMSYIFKKEGQTEEDIKDWTAERYVAIISKESKVLVYKRLLRELNFKNEHLMKRIRLYRETGRYAGSSSYEKIKSIQHGASDIFNMVVNIAYLIMMPWFLYSESSGLDKQYQIELGKGIKCDDPSKVVFPKFTQNPRSFIVFIEMFMSLWEKLGSIGDIQIGRLSESRKDATATETMAAIQEGNIKHNYQSVALKEDYLSLIRTIYDLYYQKMPFDKKFLYEGQEVSIPRMAMRRPYKFKLMGSTDLSNKILETQKNENMFAQLRQDPLSNPIKLLTNLVESYKPDEKAEEYINPIINQVIAMIQQFPELPQLMQQYAQAVQAQAVQQEQTGEVDKAAITGQSAGNAIMDRVMEALGGMPSATA